MTKLTEAALEWARAGIPVFPCTLDKRPKTARGLLDATTDEEQIKEWFSDETSMIGGRMGDGVFALDFDLYKGEEARGLLNTLAEKGFIPSTQTHITKNGGVHLLYAGDAPTCKLNNAVDVKSRGGYIILPPSEGYKVEDNDGFADAPDGLIRFINNARRETKTSSRSQLEEKILSAKDFHESLTLLAAKLAASGMSQADVQTKLLNVLKASVASNASHERHERWRHFMEDRKGELSRIVASANTKYNPQEKTEAFRESANGFDFSRFQNTASGFFSDDPSEGTNEPEYEYDGTWPFDGEGYFYSDEISIQDQRFVIHPLFAEGEVALLAAEPKTGKTAIALNFGINLALGSDIGSTFKIPEKRGVIYFGLEGIRAIKLRVEAEKRRRKGAGQSIPEHVPFFVVERAHRLNDDKVQTTLVDKIMGADKYMQDNLGCGLGMIFIDTLTKAMPGADQNSVDDTSQLFNIVSMLRNAGCRASIVFVHHMSRQGNVRGSTNIEAEPDLVLTVKKEAELNQIQLAIKMARNIEDFMYYDFALTSYDLGENTQGYKQKAVLADLLEAAASAAAEGVADAVVHSQLIAKVIKLGPGWHQIGDICNHVRDKTRGRVPRTLKQQVINELEEAFKGDLRKVFGQYILTLTKDEQREVTGVDIKEVP